MTNPIKPKPPSHGRLQITGKAVDVNMRVKLEGVAEAVNGVATYTFDVVFRAKEKPEEIDEAIKDKKLSKKLYVHASSMDEALQILHVMGNKFKEMNRGELQEYLQRDFSQVQTRRKHDDKKGTSFHMASSDKVSGEVRFREEALSTKELEDLHTYANYLQSKKAVEDGVVSPEAQADLHNISPSSEVTLEREDGVTFNVHASSVPEGLTVGLAYPSADPGLTVDLQYASVQKRVKAQHMINCANVFVTGSESFQGLMHLLSDRAQATFTEDSRSSSKDLNDVQDAFLVALNVDVQQAALNPDFDSTELEAAFKAVSEGTADQGAVCTLFEKLTEYNELFDQEYIGGTPKIPSYYLRAFEGERQSGNEIQASGNKLELLDFYEKGFPGIKAEVLKIKKDAATFTEAEFSQALKHVMKTSYNHVLKVDRNFRAAQFGQTIFGDKTITIEDLLEDASGVKDHPTLQSLTLNQRVHVLTRNGLLPAGALLPDRDKAQEAREKKRAQEQEVRKVYIREACLQMDQIDVAIKKIRTGVALDAADSRALELVYGSLPERPYLASLELRMYQSKDSKGAEWLQKRLSIEKQFIKGAYNIDIQGSSFEEFFANYLRYVIGNADLKTADTAKMPRVVEVF